MMSSVPQFIDVEDKIAGPLTWRQLGWLIAMGSTIFLLYSIFDKTLTIVLSIPTVLLFLLLAFYRPNGFPMVTYIGQAIHFTFRPKVAIWERPIPRMTQVKSKTAKEEVKPAVSAKHVTPQSFQELARMLDSREWDK